MKFLYKIIIYFSVTLSLFLQSNSFYFDEHVTFHYMEYALEQKGTFNVTKCVKDLMNCWQIIRGDHICQEWMRFGSLCEVMYEYCDDEYGDQDFYHKHFQIFEHDCDWKEHVHQEIPY